MKIAIIGAMAIEIEELKKHLKGLKEKKILEDLFFLGRLGEHEIILTESHVGVAAASSQLTSIIMSFDIDYVINIGVCGGIKGKVDLLDLVVAKNACYYGADATAFPEYVYGQIPKFPPFFSCEDSLAKGLEYKHLDVVSGDKFVNSMDMIASDIKKLKGIDPSIVDMESASFAQIAYKYHKPITIVRTISDIIGEEGQAKGYRNTLEEASLKSCKFVLDILDRK